MSRKILVVDDSKTIRTAVKWVLAKGGDSVDAAESIETARAMDRPDLAIVDYHLPDGDAAAFCSELAQDGVHIVMLTGDRHDASVAEGFTAVRKPFKSDDLLDGIAQATGDASAEAVEESAPEPENIAAVTIPAPPPPPTSDELAPQEPVESEPALEESTAAAEAAVEPVESDVVPLQQDVTGASTDEIELDDVVEEDSAVDPASEQVTGEHPATAGAPEASKEPAAENDELAPGDEQDDDDVRTRASAQTQPLDAQQAGAVANGEPIASPESGIVVPPATTAAEIDPAELQKLVRAELEQMVPALLREALAEVLNKDLIQKIGRYTVRKVDAFTENELPGLAERILEKRINGNEQG